MSLTKVSKPPIQLMLVAVLLGLFASIVLAGPMNRVVNIRRVSSPHADVEIELWSSKPFPVRALPYALEIGDQVFLRSRSPADGSLNRLIFLLTNEEFKNLRTGARMVVVYGSNELAGNAVWDFGHLNKNRLR